jgi:hypothetical protein
VGLNVRRSTGSTAQSVQLQTTFMSASRKVPLMALQMMGICATSNAAWCLQTHKEHSKHIFRCHLTVAKLMKGSMQ